MKKIAIILTLTLAFGPLAEPASAQFTPQATAIAGSAPEGIGYQGRLEDGGFPVNATKSMVFRVYSAVAAGTLLWTSPAQNVSVTLGLFNAVVPVPVTTLVGGGARYLEVQIDGTIMAPRELLNSVPYALIAKSVEGTIDVSTAGLAINANSTATQPALYISSQTGNVGVGTGSPSTAFDVGGSAQFGSGSTKSTFTATGALNTAGKVTAPDYTATYGLNAATATIVYVQSSSITTTGNVNVQGSLGVGVAFSIPGTKLHLSSGVLTIDGNATNALTTVGRVGIGTALPASKLHLSTGTLTVDGTGANIRVTGHINFDDAIDSMSLGENAGNVNTGVDNVFAGQGAGMANVAGAQNTFLGKEAGLTNISGSRNTFLGNVAGRAVTDSDNTIIGSRAMNIASGADSNVAIGEAAAFALTTGDENVFIGEQAALTATPANGTTTGSGNTFVGYRSGQSGTTQLTGSSAFGYQSLVGCSDCNSYGIGTTKHGFGTDLPASKLHLSSGTLTIDGNTATALTTVGNVGVGTELPASKIHMSSGTLTIDGNTATALTTVGNVGVGTALPASKIHMSSGTLTIDGNTATALTTVGNVGVGTTLPASKLHISSGTIIVDGNTATSLMTTGAAFIAPKDGATATATTALTIEHNTSGVVGDGFAVDMTFALQSPSGAQLNPSGRIYSRWTSAAALQSVMDFQTRDGGSMIDAMRINHLGNVGVGTALPASRLHMSSGTITVDGNAATAMTTIGNVGVGTGGSTPADRLEVAGGNVRLTAVAGSAGSVKLFSALAAITVTCNTQCGANGFCLAAWDNAGTISTCATAAAATSNRCLCSGFGN